MLKSFINPLLFVVLLGLAVGIACGMDDMILAGAVGLASAAFIANATLAVAKALTQRAVFASSMWSIAFAAMLGLLLSGSLIKPSVQFDEEVWSFSAEVDDPDAAYALLKSVALGKTSELPPEWDAAGEEALVATFVALEYKNERFLRNMLKAGISPDALLEGSTLLGSAVVTNHLPCMRIILEAGAKPDLMGGDDMSPLMSAALGSNADAIELLIKFGANPALKNSSGSDAKSYARTSRIAEML